MQCYKLLEIEGTPTLAIFELRNGQYWDGIRVTRMGDGVTPMPDGFYVGELTRDGAVAQGPGSGVGGVKGPYASVKEAERKMRKSMTELARIGEARARRPGPARSRPRRRGQISGDRHETLSLAPRSLLTNLSSGILLSNLVGFRMRSFP